MPFFSSRLSFSARLRRPLPVLVVFLLAWLCIALQHEALWQRLPASNVDRFVADGIRDAPLSPPLARDELWQLCVDAPSAPWRRRLAGRAALAGCLADARAWRVPAEALPLASAWRLRIERQQDEARRWLEAFEAQAGARRAALEAQLDDLKSRRPGLASAMASRAWWTLDGAPREPVGRRSDADAAEVAQVLRRGLAAARAALEASPANASPALAARDLGLAAAGLALRTDHGRSPSVAYLAPAHGSLAVAIERQRRGSAYGAQGDVLALLHALPSMLLISGALLLVAAAATGAPLLPWLVTGALSGAGTLLLVDLALTGDPALRHLSLRQFLLLNNGGGLALAATLPASAFGEPLRLWLPAAFAAAAIVGVRLVVACRRGALAAAMVAWVGAARSGTTAAAQAALLLALAAAGVVASGASAAVSEWLILIGAIGLATCTAQQAELANVGVGLARHHFWLVAAALAAAVGGALLRGDFGHALVATVMAAGFLLMFAAPALRAALAAALLAVAAVLVAAVLHGAWPAPAAEAIAHLPAHAQDRFAAMVSPYAADSSDLARVRWLMDSAGPEGWGIGRVPWQGLLPGGRQDTLPLQGPSDYALGLAAAVWGGAGAAVVGAAALALLLGAAWRAAGVALAPATPAPVRWLASIGLFGCLAAGVRAALSFAGTLGLAPLTGLPVALLGYGPVASIAALGYLVLALAPLRPEPLGRAARKGCARQRLAVLTAAGGALAAGIALLAVWRLLPGVGDAAPAHVAEARLTLGRAVAAALVPRSDAVSAEPPSRADRCEALASAAEAWNRRLVQTDRPLRLDPAQLRAALPAHDRSDCAVLAARLGRALDQDFERIVALPGVDARDFTTRNLWAVRPGCVTPLDGPPPAVGCAGNLPTIDDAALAAELLPRLGRAAATPAGSASVNGRVVPQGPVLALTLDPVLQASAERIAGCYAGRRRGEADCLAALPDEPAARRRLLAPGSLRAGAVGLIAIEVDSGRVRAMASALSDCSVRALAVHGPVDARGRRLALRPGEPCAQWPDAGSRYLASQAPVLWQVPPGSALKPAAVLSGIGRGAITPAEDDAWKRLIAQSRDQRSVQRLALEGKEQYLGTLAGLGFAEPGVELLFGRSVDAAGGWSVRAHAGTERLAASALSVGEVEALRREKEAGVDIDRRHGTAKVRAFLAARSLMDASVGGADLRLSTLGLADLLRRIDARSRGLDTVPAVHLVERAGLAPAQVSLRFAAPAAARRTLGVLGGVTAAALGGTAANGCRIVFGACPAEGLAGLAGKTGTADFLNGEDSPYVKPGLQLPAKLFAGVFSTSDGRRLAVAVMVLRVREGDSDTLELHSSAAAEAALTLLRGLRATTAPTPVADRL